MRLADDRDTLACGVSWSTGFETIVVLVSGKTVEQLGVVRTVRSDEIIESAFSPMNM